MGLDIKVPSMGTSKIETLMNMVLKIDKNQASFLQILNNHSKT
jgi:hypothetical protein